MASRFDAYDDLVPDEHDLADGWKKVADLPPATSDLIVPFQYADDRRPTEPHFVLADGMVSEMRDELKDGHAVLFTAPVFGTQKCLCRTKVHHRECRLARSVLHAVTKLLREMEARTRLKLALSPMNEGDNPLMLDDKDGLAPPEVRFALVPYEAKQGTSAP